MRIATPTQTGSIEPRVAAKPQNLRRAGSIGGWSPRRVSPVEIEQDLRSGLAAGRGDDCELTEAGETLGTERGPKSCGAIFHPDFGGAADFGAASRRV